MTTLTSPILTKEEITSWCETIDEHEYSLTDEEIKDLLDEFVGYGEITKEQAEALFPILTTYQEDMIEEIEYLEEKAREREEMKLMRDILLWQQEQDEMIRSYWMAVI